MTNIPGLVSSTNSDTCSTKFDKELERPGKDNALKMAPLYDNCREDTLDGGSYLKLKKNDLAFHVI